MDAVRINGNQISWSSVKLRIDGIPFTGITAVEYADSRERAYAYGMGRHHAPRGRTAGKYTPDPFVLTCWTSTARTIRELLAARSRNGRSFGDTPVTIVLQYIERDDAIITVEALECVLTKNETSNEEGPEGLNEKLTFMPMRLVRDGLTMYDSAERGA